MGIRAYTCCKHTQMHTHTCCTHLYRNHQAQTHVRFLFAIHCGQCTTSLSICKSLQAAKAKAFALGSILGICRGPKTVPRIPSKGCENSKAFSAGAAYLVYAVCRRPCPEYQGKAAKIQEHVRPRPYTLGPGLQPQIMARILNVESCGHGTPVL